MKDWKTLPKIVCELCLPMTAIAEAPAVWWERDIAEQAQILVLTNAQMEAMIARELRQLDVGQSALAARAAAAAAQLEAELPRIEAEIRATLAALEGPTRPEIVHAIRAKVAREQGSAP